MSIDNLSADYKSDVFYGVSKSVHTLSKEKIVPLLSNLMRLAELSTQKKLTDKEKAFIGLYFRVHGWLESVALMNTSACFQGVAVAGRAIFELVLDLEMLENDPTGENLKKFSAFPDMDRADAAEKCLKFFRDNKQTPQLFREEHLLGAIVYNKPQVDSNRVALWDEPKHGAVKHWSGNNDIRQRAKSIKGTSKN